MIPIGTTITTSTGRKVVVKRFISSGGQGVVYFVTDVRSGASGVIKVFHDKFDKATTEQRIRYLISKQLNTKCRTLIAPTELFSTTKFVGHYAPFVAGQSLEQIVANPKFDFYQGLCVALAIAWSVDVLHTHEIASGDIHAGNYLIAEIGSHFEVQCIDNDNFAASGAPPPPMIGHELYTPLELRDELLSGRPILPSILTDRYELTVLLHEVILLCHPAAGQEDSETGFQRAMSGRWLLDPTLLNRASTVPGYSPFALNSDLCRLFRKGLSTDPHERPTAREWVNVFAAALDCVDYCNTCKDPSIIESGKTCCPVNRHPYPQLKLVIKDSGKTIPLHGTTCIGRNDLGGSACVSGRHATVRQTAFGITLETFGRNGTYRWNCSEWEKIPDGCQVTVRENEWLRFADVQVMVTR
jgi:DNA-binding helix-hairpin-helix protein with protein kinase domain